MWRKGRRVTVGRKWGGHTIKYSAALTSNAVAAISRPWNIERRIASADPELPSLSVSS